MSKSRRLEPGSRMTGPEPKPWVERYDTRAKRRHWTSRLSRDDASAEEDDRLIHVGVVLLNGGISLRKSPKNRR
jgi:hypothetical protein